MTASFVACVKESVDKARRVPLVVHKPYSGKPKMAICRARLDSTPAERAVRHSPKVRP